MWIGPEVQAADRERGAERDREQQHRERPEDVEHAADRRSSDGPGSNPAISPSETARMVVISGGHEADEQRVAAAVEQPHHHVAADARRRPSRYCLLNAGPIGVPSGVTTSTCLPSTLDLAGQRCSCWARVRPRASRTAAPPGTRRRSGRTRASERQRDAVAPQPPPGELPRPQPRDAAPSCTVLLRDLSGRVEAEFAVGCRLVAKRSRQSEEGASAAPSSVAQLLYFRQNCAQSCVPTA